MGSYVDYDFSPPRDPFFAFFGINATLEEPNVLKMIFYELFYKKTPERVKKYFLKIFRGFLLPPRGS